MEDLERKIDKLDSEILRLLNKRAHFSVEIAKIKKQTNLPIHSPDREKFITERMVDENIGRPLGENGVRRIFERIIDEFRKLEKDIMTK